MEHIEDIYGLLHVLSMELQRATCAHMQNKVTRTDYTLDYSGIHENLKKDLVQRDMHASESRITF